jgi:hypothetical protein
MRIQTKSCDQCGEGFYSPQPAARFCCEAHRLEYHVKERRRALEAWREQEEQSSRCANAR